MTRDEAMIHTLVKENDELKMEIGRLRQALEKETCEDAVSRKEVFETFGELLGIWGRKALMELPPVLPTRKAGKWIYEFDNGAVTFYHCSVCERKLSVLKDDTIENYPFCHCGAEMEVEE